MACEEFLGKRSSVLLERCAQPQKRQIGPTFRGKRKTGTCHREWDARWSVGYCKSSSTSSWVFSWVSWLPVIFARTCGPGFYASLRRSNGVGRTW
eukprot:scaffold656_cov403-Pavlova_lutheri.AAC.5